MAGALADFSRRPAGVRVAVYVAIAVVLGLLYYQVMLGPVRKDVKKAAQDRDDAISEASALNQKKKKREELLQTQEQLRDKIEQNQKALPTDAEMPAFFDMLARKFNEAGVQVNRREIKREVQVEDFVKAPVEVEITGTYYQIMQFFASLRPRVDDAAATDETSPGVAAADKDRIVTVENLTVYDSRVLNNQLIMTAKFTAATFRTVPVVAPATPPAKPGAPATPPAAGVKAATPGPATSTPPLTPGAAKRAAESAYDKADERAREAAGADGEPLLRDDAPAPAKPPGGGLDRIKGGQ